MSAWRHSGFWITLSSVLACGLLVLFLQADIWREAAFTLLLYVALASSLNILMGFCGYVNFGHIVFFGLGGYVGFYLLSQQDWPLIGASLAGGATAALLAWLLGSAILRLRGAYFALATIGINEAARAFVSNFAPFGGATGLSLNFSVYQRYGGAARALWITYACMLVVTLGVLLTGYLIKHSRFGLGLMGIREDEDAALVLGVHTPRLKTLAYVISAFFPGVIGTLFFFKNGNIEPGDAFRFGLSIEMLVIVMLGGQGTVLGPVLGALIYERLREYLLTSPIFKDLHLAFSGLALLLIVLFVPAGLVGWLRARWPRLRGALE